MGSLDGKEIHCLSPGWNNFPTHIWSMYESHPDIVKMIKDGDVEIMDKVVKEGKKTRVVGADDKPVELTDFSEDEAVKIVASTFKREMLQNWLDGDNRSKVRRALEKQIDKLDPSKQDGNS